MKGLRTLFPLLGSIAISSCHSRENGSSPPANAPYEFTRTEVSEVTFNTGLFVNALASELPLSVGSGIRTVSYNDETGEAILYAVTDRGPNSDSPPPLQATDELSATKVFALPTFQPSLLRMSFDPTHGLRVLERIGFQENGRASTGLPIPAGMLGATGELGLDENLQPLPFDPQGLDPEGIDFDSEGYAWICDEYGPFLIKVDAKTGEILQKVGPGKGLPSILAERQPNRGFEGLAIADGKIYAIVQSTLDVAGQTKKIADFIRLVEFDPAKGTSRMFAYPIDAKVYGKTSDAKIGDLLALGKGRFAVIEQGLRADKSLHNLLYGIDLSEATDLSGLTIKDGAAAGKELEYSQLASLAPQGIKPIRKVLLDDLRASGWKQEKAEGLAKLNDKTLLIVSDNDFGLKGSIEGGPSADIEDYTIENSRIFYQGVPSDVQYRILENDPATQVMILKRDNALSSF